MEERRQQKKKKKTALVVWAPRAPCATAKRFSVFFDEREKERKKERKTAVGTFL